MGGAAPDLPSLLQRLETVLDWIDPQLRGSLHRPGAGIALGKVFTPSELGTLHGKQELSKDLQALAERIYKTAKNSIQEQWAEAKRTGKHAELIERWKKRMLRRLPDASSVGADQQTRRDAVESVTEQPSAPPVPVTRATSKKTWVEFRLIDEDGSPVPNAAYKVKLPDGSITEGSLNEKGMVRFDNIDPGQCKITFTEIDAREWQPL